MVALPLQVLWRSAPRLDIAPSGIMVGQNGQVLVLDAAEGQPTVLVPESCVHEAVRLAKVSHRRLVLLPLRLGHHELKIWTSLLCQPGDR